MHEPARILLIEDDEDDYLLVHDQLADTSSQASYQLDWESDYKNALSIIQNDKHELYLIDYRLGVRNGIDLIREAKANGCQKPFILLNGKGGEEIDMEAMQAGAADYVVKHEITQSLERAIRNALACWQTEQKLHASEQLQRAILENIDEVITVVKRDPNNSSLTRVEYVTPHVEELTGYNTQEFIDDPKLLYKIIHPDDAPEIRQLMLDQHKHKTLFNCEYRIRHKSGKYSWIENRIIPQLDEHGEIKALIGIGRDITAQKDREEKLVIAALHDSLTGLPNRDLLNDRLQLAIRRVKRNKNFQWAILFLDLDGFKQINDTYGHEAGDQFLIETARRIGSCLRPTDTLVRLGGDEFVVLLEDIRNQDDVKNISTRIQQVIEHPIEHDGNQLSATISIGITLCRPRYSSPVEVLRDADKAMYRAKQRGKARDELFETKIFQQAL